MTIPTETSTKKSASATAIISASDIDTLRELVKLEQNRLLSSIVEDAKAARENDFWVERLVYLDGLSEKLLSLKE